MIGLSINNDLHDLSLWHLYLLTNLKALPLDFRRKKTKKYLLSQSIFTENFHQSLKLQSGQKPLLPIVLFIYLRNFSREYFILFVKNVHVDTGVLKLHFQVCRAFDF